MRRLLFALLGLGVLTPPAQAALVVPHTVESLNDAADLVVRGRVARRWSKWDEAHRRIWTYTEVEVLEDLRGSGTAPDVLTLRTIGGTVGDVSMRMSGAPELEPEGEFVLFLRTDPGGHHGVVGLSQGAFRLQRDADLVVAVPLLEGLAFVPLRAEQVGQTRIVKMALEALREALAEAADPAAISAPAVPAVPDGPTPPSSPPTPGNVAR